MCAALAFQAPSKSPHRLTVAVPLWVKYSLLPKETPHSGEVCVSGSEALKGTALDLPGQLQPEIDPAMLVDRGSTHLLPCHTAPEKEPNQETK